LRHLWLVVSIILLAVAVVGLSTVAKQGQYSSKADPIRNISISTKMDVTRVPAVLAKAPLQPLARIVLVEPPVQASRVEHVIVAPISRVAVAVSMRHRSPPAFLS